MVVEEAGVAAVEERIDMVDTLLGDTVISHGLAYERGPNPGIKEWELGFLPVGSTDILYGGSNQVLSVNLTGDGRGVFKPGRGERYLYEFAEPEFRDAEGNLYKRERAAYLVSKALGLNLVPVTSIRDINGEAGSIQDYIEDAKSIWDITGDIEGQYYLMSIFDYLIWNKDRKASNMLFTDEVDPDRSGVSNPRLHLIDNGLSFDPWDNDWGPYMIYRNLADNVFGKEIPEEIKRKFVGFSSDPSRSAQLGTELRELLPQPAVNAFMARLRYLTLLFGSRGSIEEENLVSLGHNLRYNPT